MTKKMKTSKISIPLTSICQGENVIMDTNIQSDRILTKNKNVLLQTFQCESENPKLLKWENYVFPTVSVKHFTRQIRKRISITSPADILGALFPSKPCHCAFLKSHALE